MIDYSFTKHADRQLRKLPITTQRRIIKKIKFYITTGDPLHFADSISDTRSKVYRFRIGNYRVIFDWLGNNLLVTKVDLRPRIY